MKYFSTMLNIDVLNLQQQKNVRIRIKPERKAKFGVLKVIYNCRDYILYIKVKFHSYCLYYKYLLKGCLLKKLGNRKDKFVSN